MSGISSMASVSRRACYCRHFSELLARVRSAVRVQRNSSENILAGLSGDQFQKSFPLPGTLTVADSLLSSPRLKPTAQKFVPPPNPVLSDFFNNLNYSETRLAAVNTQVQMDAHFSKVDKRSVKEPRPLRVEIDQVEFVVHDCNDRLRKSFEELFPCGIPEAKEEDFCTILISHCTKTDMSAWSTEMEQEREELTAQFIATAKEIVEALKKNGVWADFIDPASGRPFYSPYTNATLFETDDRYRQFGFRIQDLGCCKCLEHPVWGGKVFVGCIFATTSSKHPVLKGIIQSQAN